MRTLSHRKATAKYLKSVNGYLKRRAYEKRRVTELSDKYIRDLLSELGFDKNQITNDLIEERRLILKIKRFEKSLRANQEYLKSFKTKMCPSCGTQKPLPLFYKKNNYVRSKCIKCTLGKDK